MRSFVDCRLCFFWCIISNSQHPFDVHAEDDEAQDASSSIPLDDGMAVDFRAIEVIQCLIGHHNAVFADASETVWR